MNKYIPYVWTFTFPDSSKILNNPYLIINTLVILFFLYPIISLKSSKCGDPIISIATKALPGVLAHEPRGRCGCCGEPIRREDSYSREAVATRTPAALVFLLRYTE